MFHSICGNNTIHSALRIKTHMDINLLIGQLNLAVIFEYNNAELTCTKLQYTTKKL